MKSIEPVYSPTDGGSVLRAELLVGGRGAACSCAASCTEVGKWPAVTGLRLLIVDRQALFCSGLATMFRAVPEVSEVAVASTPEQAVRIAKLVEPDLLVIDATMPDYQGFQTAELLLETAPGCRVLFLDDTVNPAHIRSALRLGAFGYWTKRATFDEILAAVLRIGRGWTAFCPAAVAEKLPYDL